MTPLRRFPVATLVGAATWLLAGSALAQEGKALGADKSFVLSLEHLGGYSNQRVKFDDEDASTNHEFGLFTPFLGPLGSHARIGLHYFAAPPLSLGALLSYSDNDFFGTFVLAGARVGVAFPISGATALWLRGGIAYARSSLEFGDSSQSYSALVPGGEVLFALKPLDHFGFLVGGMFETTVGGKAKSEEDPCSSGASSCSQEADFSQREFGLTLGIFLEL
ncbi:MAG: hypothetical protein HYZ29_05180 [Myxococcales bacterium]|nr:hypothetical protein [Myxococcales bacterium]